MTVSRWWIVHRCIVCGDLMQKNPKPDHVEMMSRIMCHDCERKIKRKKKRLAKRKAKQAASIQAPS